MSEYQYYEFQAIDRPLSDKDRAELRGLSTRARITATSFTNSYEWGDFKGDPAKLIQRWFDLHLYTSNWGTRRLIMRLPKRLMNRKVLDGFLRHVECATLQEAGDNLILDICREELEPEVDEDDGAGQLSKLASLRADLLGGDQRLLYLLWLTAVETDAVEAADLEPLPGLGPFDGALEAFADFFQLDWDLVEAAAERPAALATEMMSQSDAVRGIVAALSDEEKTAWLIRVIDGDPHAATGIRSFVRDRLEAGTVASLAAIPRRTVSELSIRAEAIGQARQEAAARQAEAARKEAAATEERIRRMRLDALKQRGGAVWREIEAEITRRNAAGYDRAAALLQDMKALAAQDGTTMDFSGRLRSVRERHASKAKFIERLKDLG